MPNVKAVVEYDGTDFYGFQIQRDRRTVQGEIEQALAKLLHKPDVKVVGAGRTDAGVHARGQVINFMIDSLFPVNAICKAMNRILPRDIRFRCTEIVDDSFHARHSAVARRYAYVIKNSKRASVMCSRYVWEIESLLDINAMRGASRCLIGTHDFASFGKPPNGKSNTVRSLMELWIHNRGDLVVIGYQANAFLHGMVRSITGTLAEIGVGRRDPKDIKRILEKKDRNTAGLTAPSRGLYLIGVDY